MPRGTIVKAGHVRAGVDTIVERSDYGNVLRRVVVFETMPCSDLSQIHVIEPGGKVNCYYKEADVELL